VDTKSDLPDGWAVPDDLAKKISEVLNNKPISPENELADALEYMARDISLIELVPDNVIVQGICHPNCSTEMSP
jgi:hypothetical protein